jgi:predicted PurR-regulated permease PerM
VVTSDVPLPPETPPHRALVSNIFLVIALVLLAAVAYPLWQPLLFAAILGSVLWPVQKWLRGRLWHRRYLASTLLTVGVVVLILTPLTIIGIIAVQQAIEAAGWVKGAYKDDVNSLLRPLPDHIERGVKGILDRFPQVKALNSQAEAGKWVATQLQNVLTTVSSFAFDLAMMLIALFFVLADGNHLADWIKKVSPMGPSRTNELLKEFRVVARSVIGANFLTGLLQAVVATGGYLIAQVPQPLFFGLITLLTSFIPSVGTSIVSLPLAGLLFLMGHPWAALFLTLWSVLFVATVDNLVRPMLIKGDLDVHGALIFFSIIGGIGIFGMAGIVVGPMALTWFLTMIRFYRRDVREELAVAAGNGGPLEPPPPRSDKRIPGRA